MTVPIAQRVATRYLLAQGEFQVGDPILYGKYKNKRGIIIRIFDDEKGHPTLEIEPVPKGRKQNKEIGLYKIWHDPNPPDPVKTALVERVVQRYLTAAIHWKKTPLNNIKGDMGIYARSEPDGRFLVHVRRWRSGQPGDRKYTLFYSAIDYQTPSEGKRYSEIPVSQGSHESVNASKVFAAVEKWAQEHPVADKAASTEEYDDHDFDE